MFESSPFKVILPVGVAQVVGLDGVGLVITGTAFTTTLTELDAEVQPFCVIVKLYVPVATVVAALIVGLALILVKLLGPVQL